MSYSINGTTQLSFANSQLVVAGSNNISIQENVGIQTSNTLGYALNVNGNTNVQGNISRNYASNSQTYSTTNTISTNPATYNNTKIYLPVYSVIQASNVSSTIVTSAAVANPSIITYGPYQSPRWIAVGSNNLNAGIVRSSDGVNWTPVTQSVLTGPIYGIAWNGILWVAIGNSIAWSSDGITWNSGTTIFTIGGSCATWNGSIWLAGGAGATYYFAFSTDGKTWTGITQSVLNNVLDIAWNGSLWVAVGQTTNTTAWSTNGTTWTAGTNIFTGGAGNNGSGVAWNGSIWVAVGRGTTNTIAWSSDGKAWTGLGKTIFSTSGSKVAWNGSLWVAVGTGTYSIAWSTNGTTWTGVTTTPWSGGNTISWSGSTWIAGGLGATNNFAYSVDGKNWTGVGGTTGLNNGVYGIAYNALRANNINFAANGSAGTVTGTVTQASSITITYQPIEVVTWSYTQQNVTSQTFSVVSIGGESNLSLSNTIAANPITNSKTSVALPIGNTVTSANVSAKINTISAVTQNTVITYGPYQRPILIGSGGNAGSFAIYYSYDNGTTGTATNYTSSSDFNNIIWNGSLWVGIGGKYGYSTDGITWTNSGSNFNLSQPYGLGWNGSIWIATSLFNDTVNNISYSSNGITWTNLNLPGSGSYISVTWNGLLWVVVGNNNTSRIKYSYTGTSNWIDATITSGSNVVNGYSVEWNGTMFLVGGQGGSPYNVLSYSSDGITWTNVPNSNFENSSGSAQVRSIKWNGSIWVLGGSGFSTNQLFWSTDGMTWTGVTGTTIFTQCWTIIWNGTKFIAGGRGNYQLAWSTDGKTWIPIVQSLPNIISGLGFNSARPNTITFPANVSAGIVTGTVSQASSITTSSQPVEIVSPPYNQTGVSAYSVTINTSSVTSKSQNYLLSTNLINYTKTYSKTAFTLPVNSVIQANNVLASIETNLSQTNPSTVTYGTYVSPMWVGLGSGTNIIVNSTDGITWTTNSSTVFATGLGAAWNGSLWVAVGSAGSNTIAWSNDGLTWTGLGTGTFSSQANSVLWNGSLWVAVGSGTNTTAWSTNGTTWTAGTNIFSAGYGLAWNGTIWVAVGSGTNTVAWSNDGKVWTGLGSVLSSSGRAVAWNGSMFIAVGSTSNNLPYSSVDGKNWSSTSVSGSTLFTLGYGIAWNGSLWVEVGTGASSTGSHSIAYSYDGMNWTGVTGQTIFGTGFGIFWNGYIWVATGQTTNTLAYSYDGINWQGLGTTALTTAGYGVSYNSARANRLTFPVNASPGITKGTTSQSSSITVPSNSLIEVITDSYTQNGVVTLSVNIQV